MLLLIGLFILSIVFFLVDLFKASQSECFKERRNEGVEGYVEWVAENTEEFLQTLKEKNPKIVRRLALHVNCIIIFFWSTILFGIFKIILALFF